VTKWGASHDTPPGERRGSAQNQEPAREGGLPQATCLQSSRGSRVLGEGVRLRSSSGLPDRS